MEQASIMELDRTASMYMNHAHWRDDGHMHRANVSWEIACSKMNSSFKNVGNTS